MNLETIDPLEISEPSIGQEVAENHHKAIVLKQHGIDFCCGGKKTLSQICLEKNLDFAELRKELDVAGYLNNSTKHDFNSWSPSFLADYIVNTHHRYIERSAPELLAFTNKIARVHSSKQPELLEVENLFRTLASELAAHMKKEELILFPFIRQIFQATPGIPRSGPLVHVGIEAPIRMMEQEHESAGQLLKHIRELTSDFQLPQNSCGSYRVTFSMLREFEEDLHQHIHLENNILFPKSLEQARRSIIA